MVTSKESLKELLGTDEQILEFASIVEKYAEEMNNGIYSNSGPVHAAIVLGNIFKNTKKSIHAFVEDLNGTVTNHPYCKRYFDIVINNDDIDVNYILRNNPLNDKKIDKTVINKLISRAKRNPSKTKIFLLKDNDKNLYNDNFTLSDGFAYRYEDDTENYIASFTFNDEDRKNSNIIKKIFDILQTKHSIPFPN